MRRAVRRHLGEHDAPWDVNRDGRVNAADLRQVRDEMRRAGGPPALASVLTEPSSLALLAAAGAGALGRSWLHRHRSLKGHMRERADPLEMPAQVCGRYNGA